MKSKPELTFFVEPLERRLMLSGNVLATMLGSDLWIRGDEFDNDLSLEVNDNQVVLIGNGQTTINGSADPFVVSESSSIERNLFVKLGRGNDQFVTGPGIEVGRSAYITGGSGDDTIGVTGINVSRKLKVSSGSGDDSIALLDVDAERVTVSSSRGDDFVSVDNVSVDRHLKIYTSSGNDDVVVQNALVDRHLIAFTGSGDDNLVIENSEIQGKLISFTGSGDDVVRVDNSSVEGVSLLFTNSGDDAVEITDTSEFAGRVRVFGGSGSDTSTAADSVQSDNLRFFSTDSDGVAAGLTEARLDSPTAGAIPQVAAIQSSLFDVDNSDSVVTQPEALSLSLDTSSANNLIASNGTDIATDSNFTIEGQTTAGNTVEIDQNGDGLFDDGTVTADENGVFSIATTLTNDATNLGVNDIQVRVTDESGEQVTESTSVHFAQGTVVRYTTSLGDFDIELLDDAAPVTVENFLSYFDEFEGSIIHRSPGTGFVIQGGGFTAEDGIVESIPTDPPIDSEFDPANSNLRGTISTALLGGDPDSATSGWFINTSDNSFLDASGHTVFGRVIGDGLNVVDAIDQLPSFDVSTNVGPAFGEVPLRDFTPALQQLSGTLSLDSNADLVTGTGTEFTTELALGQTILLNNTPLVVSQIISDTELVIDANSAQPESITDADGLISPIPTDDNYVFIDIAQL